MQPEDPIKREDSKATDKPVVTKPSPDEYGASYDQMEDSDDQPSRPSEGQEPKAEPVVQSQNFAPPSQGFNASPSEYSQSPVAAPVKEPTNPGLIVLQWLTYAFWGWTVLALSFLTASVVANYMNDTDSGGATSYGVAAVLVLLPLSFVLDSFYSKKEPAHKEGAAVWVMVVHAVIFAIFGIGALITAVVALVAMFTSSSDSKGAQTTLVCALIIAAFYGVTFLRTLNPALFRWIQSKYKIIMLATVGVIVVLGVIGPVAKDRATRDDRLITSEISAVSNSISDYARMNKKLPADLKALDLRGDAQQLVDRGLVEYKPEASSTSTSKSVPATTTRGVSSTTYTYNSTTAATATTGKFRYQLCVNYKKEQRNPSNYGGSSSSDTDTDGYRSYLYVYDHPAGDVCYKLKTSDY